MFEFPYMSFGLRNAAQTFQRFIDEVLRGLDFCYVYIDDILVASTSEEEHLQHLKIIFERFKSYGVIVNPSKCTLGKHEAKFLGYLVSAEGTQPLPDKVQAIRSYPRPQTAKKLRQFLGMLNFYRRFISKATQLQAPLNDLLQGNIKGKTPVNWNPEAQVAFEHCKEGLAQAALLAHPEPDATLALVCDASEFTVGAALHQQINGGWEPLGFFSKKLSSTEKKYGAYDRELLAIYLAVKYFRDMVEARTFTIFTDHKPITFAFRQKPDKCSPRQFRHLDFIGQFTTDIRHISGKDNVVADALSRVEELAASIDFEALAASQQSDEELKTYVREGSLLQLRQMRISETDVTVFCDVSTSITRPFVTAPFRRAAFNTVHQLSHPGIKATIKLATQRYVWPAIKNDCRRWARACIECQKSKVSRHVSAPRGSFTQPTARFEHVHIDIVILPVSEWYRYCLTCVDRFTRWPEAFPLENQEANTVARAFYEGWITRFGTPLRVTTDQGRQFESHLFKQLAVLTGTTHLRTTAYHPAANGMVERLHRQLKAAIKCHQNNRWTEALPTVLLGIRAAWREDLQATAAELVYGEPLRLPGECLIKRSSEDRDDAANYVKELRQHFRAMRPVNGTHHGDRRIFVFKDLRSSEHVFVSHGAPGGILQQPYNGPFRVVSRNDRTFVVNIRGKDATVSIDRLKPAYVISGDSDNAEEHATDRVVQPREEEDDPAEVSGPPPTQQPGNNTNQHTTRTGRRVRFPERRQIGISWLAQSLAGGSVVAMSPLRSCHFQTTNVYFYFFPNFLLTKTNNRLRVFPAIKLREKGAQTESSRRQSLSRTHLAVMRVHPHICISSLIACRTFLPSLR